MKKWFIALLLTVGMCPSLWANGSDIPNDIVFPEGGNFYLVNVRQDAEPGVYYFSGTVEMRGMLEAGWIIDDVTETGRIEHQLQIHFLPEQSQLGLLPGLRSDVYSTQAGAMILLNSDLKQVVERYFTGVPEGFFLHEEGVLSVPVSAVIDEYGTYVDGDCRYFQARLVSVRILEALSGPVVQKQCSGLVFAVDMYMTQSSDGYVNLRAQPSSQSTILRQLPNDTLMVKVYTQGNWYFFRLMNEPDVQGYVHRSQVVGAN